MHLERWQTNRPVTAGHVLTVPCVPPETIELRLKRLMDVVVAATLLVLLSPVLLVIALLIKLTSPGPVFHIQTQIGLNQRPFTMWKFRTMIPNAHLQEAALRAADDAEGPFLK